MTSAGGNAGRGIEVVASDVQAVRGSAVWCAAMQVCWDNMLETLCGGGPLNPLVGTNELVRALNASRLERGALPKDHFYAYSGPKNNRARREIETEVRRRFGQSSEVLDQLDWSEPSPGMTSLLFYCMLYRKFSFPVPFGVCEDEPWGDGDACVTYFEADDLDRRLSRKMRQQVKPLYYEDGQHHAVSLQTKEGDSVVLVRSPRGGSFSEMWANMLDQVKRADSTQTRPLDDQDFFMCPNLSLKLSKEFHELEGQEFLNAKGQECIIDQALQTIELSLDNEGGEVKSESAIAACVTGALDFSHERHFDYDGRFALFLVAGEARANSHPYFALLVDDIRLFK